MQRLLELAQLVSSSLELPTVLQQLARAAIDLLPGAGARIWVLEGEHLALRAQAGVRGETDAATRTTFAVGEGLTGEAALRHEPLVIEDVTADGRAINRPLIAQQGVVSFVGIPLRMRGRLVGVLALFTRERHALTPDELAFLMAFGTLAAIAIDHARLYEDAARRHQALAGERALLHATLENLSQGVAVFDAALRLLAWNDRIVQLLDLPAPLVQRGTPADVFLRHFAGRGELGPGEPEMQIAQRLALARGLTQYVSHQRRPDGTVLEVRVGRMPDGGFVVAYTDVTDRVHAEKARQEAQTLATIARLASAAAHEINNPLAVILGSASLLEARATDPATRASMHSVVTATRRIQDIVARMGQITRLVALDTEPGIPAMLDLRRSGADAGRPPRPDGGPRCATSADAGRPPRPDGGPRCPASARAGRAAAQNPAT
jgi:PAS domain-containing protein